MSKEPTTVLAITREELDKEIENTMMFFRNRGIDPFKAYWILKFSTDYLKINLNIIDEEVHHLPPVEEIH